jgi:hypothetical protein
VPAPIGKKSVNNQAVKSVIDDNVSELSEESEMSLDF